MQVYDRESESFFICVKLGKCFILVKGEGDETVRPRASDLPGLTHARSGASSE